MRWKTNIRGLSALPIILLARSLFYRIGVGMEPSLIKEIFIIMNGTVTVLVGFSFWETSGEGIGTGTKTGETTP